MDEQKKTHNCSQNTSVMFRPKLGQEYKGTFLTSERNDYLSSHRTLKAYLNLRQSLLKDDCRDDF